MTSAARVPASAGRLADRLACPQCRGGVTVRESSSWYCAKCGISYPVTSGVLDFRPPDARSKAEAQDWSKHWSGENQNTLSQRFFSFYRKAVFAKAVAWFLGRYFPAEGLFVEAGSGTSETSMLVNKHGGRCTLVALDLIPAVLERCHPVMDLRLSGDIFRLPFQDNSIDGMWNVGVMEHFTHPQIRQIMREFHRVLKPGARLILLWPATFSIPQRILRVLEWFINFKKSPAEKFRFHPDEISQIRSIRQGREVLTRDGFRPVSIDPGFRTLAAFETIVGEKVAA